MEKDVSNLVPQKSICVSSVYIDLFGKNLRQLEGVCGPLVLVFAVILIKLLHKITDITRIPIGQKPIVN